MKRLIVMAASVTLMVLTGVGTLWAQLPGIPVYNTPIASGFTIGADVAFPSNSTGLGTSYAITGAFGTGLFGFTGSIGGTKVEAINKTQVTVGGTANWKVFGGPLIPLAVNLQAGVAYWEGALDSKNLRVPVGVSAMLTIPSPGMAIKPWIAPRVDFSQVEVGGTTSDQTEFAFSIGLDLAFLSGLGVRAAYDWMKSDGSTLSTIGVGLNYSFKTLSY
jgi:opacity protein-like surface antigen